MKLPGIEALIRSTGKEKTKRAYYLSLRTIKILKILSLIEGRSMSKIIEDAVERYFKEKAKEIPEEEIKAIEKILKKERL